MAARLAAYVYVTNPETRVVEGIGPDDEVPDWAARLITNPEAWDGDAPDLDDEPEPTEDADPEPPPRGGRGSSAEAWRAYAAAVGVEVAPDAERDDVIDAVAAAGKRID